MTKEERSVYNKRYYAKHQEQLKEWRRIYYAEHRDDLLERANKNNRINKDRYNAYNKAYRAANREHINEMARIYRATHREKLRAMHRAYNVKRKIKKQLTFLQTKLSELLSQRNALERKCIYNEDMHLQWGWDMQQLRIKINSVRKSIEQQTIQLQAI